MHAAPRVTLKQWIGHRVREAAMHAGRITSPSGGPSVVYFPYTSIDGCGSVRLRVYEIAPHLRALGWRVTIAPPQLELVQRRRLLRAEKPDVVVLQKGRHVLNRPELYEHDGVFVFDIDDADYADPARAANVEACCKAAAAVMAGSENVAAWCRRHNDNVTVVWTSHPIPAERASPPSRERGPVLAWGQSGSMGYAREAQIVQEIVLALRRLGVGFSFELFGADNRELAERFVEPLRCAGVAVRTHAHMPYERFLGELSRVAVGLHVIAPDSVFSQGKSFGKVLAYLASDVAVVSSAVQENVRFFRPGQTGMLCTSVDEFAESAGALLAEPEKRQEMTDAAFEDFRARLSVQAAARAVDGVLRGAIAGRTSA